MEFPLSREVYIYMFIMQYLKSQRPFFFYAFNLDSNCFLICGISRISSLLIFNHVNLRCSLFQSEYLVS